MTTNDNQSHGIVNFQNKPRCGAKSRSGKPCKNLPANGKKRCRFHGGADGIGAPKGNKNAWKHGDRSRAAIENRKHLNRVLREARGVIRQMEADRKRIERAG